MEAYNLNGIINVLKPPGMTSHDVVGFLKRTLNTRKVGHTGTLDPGVAGVLPVCFGKATRIIEFLSEDIKKYRAELTLGRSTDTQDGFGKTIYLGDASNVSAETISIVITSLQGDVMQVPPMVSALKHQGKKLYELAREGIEVERKPRKIHIYETRIIKMTGFGTPNPRVMFDVSCSKGTYVRTICHDLGEALGCGGFMSFLVRTGTGRFRIEDAQTLEEIVHYAEKGTISQVVNPLNEVVPLPPVVVNDNVMLSVQHGNRIYAAGVLDMPSDLTMNQIVKLVTRNNECLAIAKVIIGRELSNGLETTGKIEFQPTKVLC